jgi:hypothetical protein
MPLADSVFSAKTKLIDQGLIPVVLELNRLFPEAILVMSGIYAFLTMSYPYAVMFGSLLEATAIFHILRYVASYIQVADLSMLRTAASQQCRSGFSSKILSSLSMFSSESRASFPSAPLYMFSVASAYVFTTLSNQAKELQALGPAYSSRYYMSMILLLSLLFMLAAFRLTFACDSFGVILTTIPIGLIVGIMLVTQNSLLFGPSSINLLGIPLLKSKTASGKKLYVCPTQPRNTGTG